MDPREFARLAAVEAACQSLLAQPGHVTRAALAEALAVVPPIVDPVPSVVEETV